MIKTSKNVQLYTFGIGAIENLADAILVKNKSDHDTAVILVDQFFRGKNILNLNILDSVKYHLLYINSDDEPTTAYIDSIYKQVQNLEGNITSVVGIGGGSTLDAAKAISNLLTNGGSSADYQGWDLVKNPGIFKIGVPTISGTGAESSRTCVMMNHEKNLKLGMNSEFTIFDQLILDPALTKTVPRNQYFYTGLDTYIHCLESLAGSYRHAVGDAFSREALTLCREIFLDEDMMSEKNREKLMVASYLGGCAIANSYVGVVHPFSAGLSMVLGTHHCLANCIVMNVMEEFYPDETKEFKTMVMRQDIDLPKNVCKDLTKEQFQKLYDSTIVHEKPLRNALGENFKSILTLEKVTNIFKRM